MNAKLEERFRPEAILKVIEDLATRWHRHHDIAEKAPTPQQRREESIAARSYCKAISLMIDQPYSAVEDALRRGPERGGL